MSPMYELVSATLAKWRSEREGTHTEEQDQRPPACTCIGILGGTDDDDEFADIDNQRKFKT